MAYLITAIMMTLSVLEGCSPVSSLFQCGLWYLWCVALSLWIGRASCGWAKKQ